MSAHSVLFVYQEYRQIPMEYAGLRDETLFPSAILELCGIIHTMPRKNMIQEGL